MSAKAGGAGPTEVRVRPARLTDTAKLGAFFMQAWKEAGPGAMGFAGATDSAIKEIASEEFLSKRLSSPKSRIIIAEEAGGVVGFASIRRTSDKDGELSGIVVLRGSSGRGLGTRMLRKAFQVATKLGFENLVVRTEVFNKRAIGFYKKNGFVELRRASEKVGRANVPVQVLGKRLR